MNRWTQSSGISQSLPRITPNFEKPSRMYAVFRLCVRNQLRNVTLNPKWNHSARILTRTNPNLGLLTFFSNAKAGLVSEPASDPSSNLPETQLREPFLR